MELWIIILIINVILTILFYIYMWPQLFVKIQKLQFKLIDKIEEKKKELEDLEKSKTKK